ncbi:CSR1 [Candida jiufengensis]|uniref:CSR1 n=1 Tax=Candida jiufengensis TaxID=497108 RepID=UPI002224FC4D|nr:CSR1 [Candida jiufengensis]KAI5956989.1 CSR1 [Candida jiufengensis]
MSSDNVKYRLQRIQTLNGDQEIVLKQVWAYMLKYFGYELNINNQDIQYRQCFIPSTSTAHFDESHALPTGGLSKSNTRGSINSTKSSASKKKMGLFGSKKASSSASTANQATGSANGSPPANSKRMNQIQTQSSSERYIPVDIPSEVIYSVYAHHYKLAYEYADDFDGSSAAPIGGGGNGGAAGAVGGYNDYNDDANSINSIETFVTAETTLTDYDALPPQIFDSNYKNNNYKQNGGKKAYGGRIGHPNQHQQNNGYQQQQQNGFAGGNQVDIFQSTVNKPLKVNPDSSILQCFSQYNPKDLHQTLQKVQRNDLFDNLILKFIRARKWDHEKALEMFFKSLNWRANEFPSDDWVMEGDSVSYLNGTNQGFIKNFTTEKSWIKGRDKNNNPIFTFQAKKHLTSDSPLPQNQRYAVVTIEWVRLFLREVSESVDTCTIVFDLTGFSLKNADYATIKFLADVFEAHYPETLGFILIHNAPWIFSTVWNIIKNWLDPVVASKIHFTKDAKELSKFIDPTLIPDYLGGDDTTRGYYPIPEPKDEFPPRRKDAEYARLRRERDLLTAKFFETTKRWIESTNPQVSDKYLKDKIDLNIALSSNYIQLDPYIRNPGIYDRDHTLTVGH